MNHKPSIYLSGPMTGLLDFNFPAFHTAAVELRARGFPVLNPADFGVNPGETWGECLRRDITILLHCGMIVTLDGWEQSKVARLEVHVARELDIPVMTYDEFLEESLS